MVRGFGPPARCILGIAAAACAFAFAQERTYAQPADLISARDLATLRDLDGLSVSPDGAWAVFQVRRADPDANRYLSEWFVIPTAGGAPRRVAEGGEPVLGGALGLKHGAIATASPIWSPDNRWIIYLRRENGRTQLWRTRREGGTTEPLTRSEGDVCCMVHARDGRRLFFQIQPSDAQIEEALAGEGRRGFLFDDRFFPAYSPLPTSPAGALTNRNSRQAQRNEASAHKVWIYDFASKQERLANADEQAEFAELTPGTRPGGRPGSRDAAASSAGAFAWTETRDPASRGAMTPAKTIAARPSGASEGIVCAAPACTGQRIDGPWRRGEGEVVFLRGEGPGFEDTALYSWRPGESAARRVLQTPDSFEGGCAVAGDRLVCFYEKPDYPRRLAAVDLDTGAIKILYDPNPEFARFNLGAAPRRLSIRTPSGVETYGYLVLPPRADSRHRLPLVIVTYTCSGFLHGASGDEYPIYAFAAQGFAVLCFDAPRDPERQARMSSMDYYRWGWGPGVPLKRQEQEAIDAAVDQLSAANVIDPDRIGITGFSHGEQIVFYALSHMPRLHAAIASGSDHEPMDYYLQGRRSAGMAAWGWGPLEKTGDRWREFSLSLNADRVRAPLLINASEHEMLGTLQPVRALEDAGRGVEMYVFPDEYHQKWQPAHRLAIYERNIDWMNFWLRGVESPDPARATQYERWRAMRARAASR